MPKTCYKKIGNKWYGPSKIKELTKLVNDKAAAKTASAKTKIDTEINDLISSQGLTEFVDSNGNFDISDIFDRKGSSENRTPAQEILDRLHVKATTLNATNDTDVPTALEIWNTYEQEFLDAGITPEQVAEKLNNFMEARTPVGGTTDANPKLDRSTKLKRAVAKVKGWFNSASIDSAFGNINEQVVLREARINALAGKFSRSVIRLNNKIKSLKGANKLSSDQQKNILAALQGKEKFEKRGMNPAQAEIIDKFVNDIRLDMDVLSSMLQLNLGSADNMIDIIENNKGEYVTRTYQVFTNSEWVNEVFDKKTKNPTAKGKALLRGARSVRKPQLINEIKNLEAAKKKLEAELSNGDSKSPFRKSQIETAINTIQSKIDQRKIAVSSEANMNEYLRQELLDFVNKDRVRDASNTDKTGKTPNKVLKKRTNDSPEIRAFWGEITSQEDSALAITQATVRMATQLVNAQFQTALATEMIREGMYTTNSTEGDKLGWKKVNLSNEGWGTLRGFLVGEDVAKDTVIYMPEDLAELVESVINVSSDTENTTDAVIGLARSLSGVMKGAATVWNLSSQMVNIIGNATNFLRNGQVSKPYFQGVGKALQILTSQGPVSQELEYLNDIAASNNISASAVEVEVMKDLFGSKEGKAILDFFGGVGVKQLNLKNLGKVLSKMYEAGDTIFKLADLDHRLQEYAKIIDGKKSFKDVKDPAKRDLIIDMATKETRGEIANYNELWGLLKKNRESRLFGAFVSFPAEMARTFVVSKHRQGKHLLGKDLDPSLTDAQRTAIKKKALREFASNIVFGAIGTSMGPTLFALSGLDGLTDDEEEYFRDNNPSYMGNAYIWRNDEDNVVVMQSDYLTPQNYVGNMIEPLARKAVGRSSKTLGEAAAATAAKTVDPFLSLELVPALVKDIVQNDANGFGKKILEPEYLTMSTDVLAKQIGDFTSGKIPGIVSKITSNNKVEAQLIAVRQLLEETPDSDKSKKAKLNQRVNFLEKKLDASGFWYHAGFRQTVINTDQFITFNLLKKSQKLAVARGLFKDLVKPQELRPDVLDEALERTQETHAKELRGVRDEFEKAMEIFPDRDWKGILAGEYLYSNNRNVKDKDKKLFTNKETEYIMGEVDEIPLYVPETYKNRRK